MFCFNLCIFSLAAFGFLWPSATCFTKSLSSCSSCIRFSAYFCISWAVFKNKKPREHFFHSCLFAESIAILNKFTVTVFVYFFKSPLLFLAVQPSGSVRLFADESEPPPLHRCVPPGVFVQSRATFPDSPSWASPSATEEKLKVLELLAAAAQFFVSKQKVVHVNFLQLGQVKKPDWEQNELILKKKIKQKNCK